VINVPGLCRAPKLTTGLFLLDPNQVVLNSDQITCHKKLEVLCY
jgi:hypothetical protein